MAAFDVFIKVSSMEANGQRQGADSNIGHCICVDSNGGHYIGADCPHMLISLRTIGTLVVLLARDYSS